MQELDDYIHARDAVLRHCKGIQDKAMLPLLSEEQFAVAALVLAVSDIESRYKKLCQESKKNSTK